MFRVSMVAGVVMSTGLVLLAGGCSAPGNSGSPQAAPAAVSVSRGDSSDARYAWIPAEADRVDSGKGPLHYQATEKGMMWIGDDQSKRLIVRRPVGANDKIDFDPRRNIVKINGRSVHTPNTNATHVHTIFFK